MICPYVAGEGFTGVGSAYTNSLNGLSFKTDSEINFVTNPYAIYNYQ
jgi:hypothetical protein